MNCCFIIILLLLCKNGNSSCGNSCIEPRRRTADSCRPVCDNSCQESGNGCTRTQTVITRTECDANSCANNASDGFGVNRYSMYGVDDNDCGCRN